MKERIEEHVSMWALGQGQKEAEVKNTVWAKKIYGRLEEILLQEDTLK